MTDTASFSILQCFHRSSYSLRKVAMLCIPSRIQEPGVRKFLEKMHMMFLLAEVKHMGMQLALFVKTVTTI